MEPRRGHNVGASLFFEKDGEPQGQIGSVGRAQLGSRALLQLVRNVIRSFYTVLTRLEQLTERSSMLSSRWRGTTVTSSISHKNATSEGIKPGGRGKAMLGVCGVGRCRGAKHKGLGMEVENVCPSMLSAGAA